MNDQYSTEDADLANEKNKADLRNIIAGGESARGPDLVFSVGDARRQKFILIGIGAIVAVAIGFSLFKMGRVLRLPLPTTGEESAAVVQAADTESEKKPDELKKTDTDEDGINDFEELYVYETSPYLADSDSDGVADFEEIANHTDPTCAEGKNCFVAGASTSSADASGENIGVTEVSAADLRALLVKSGKVTAEQAASIDDKTLLDIYGQALEQNPALAEELSAAKPPTSVGESIADAAVANSSTPGEALQSLGAVSAADVRQMLLEQGVSEKELKAIDDQALMKLYDDALKKAGKGVADSEK